jgi:hypothetical protein
VCEKKNECRRCRLPKTISSDHDVKCTWHPRNRGAAQTEREPRIVAWVDETCYVEGQGYRVSLVHEGENGHTPTGTWPYHGKPGETLPWFWGPTIKDAQQACEEYNLRMGIDKEEAFKIVVESMSDAPSPPYRR